jgi:uroporphyrinogen decarboxylase
LDSRQRVKRALEHKSTDRIPVDLGSSGATGISAAAYSRVIDSLNLSSGLVKLYDFMQQLAYPQDGIMEEFNIDVIDPGQFFLKSQDNWRQYIIPNDGTRCVIPSYWDSIYDIEVDEKETVYISHKDGTTFGKMPKSSRVVDQVYWPFQEGDKIPENMDLDWAFDRHLWMIPQPFSIAAKTLPGGKRQAAGILREEYQKSDKAIMFPAGGNLFDIGFTLRGMDKFLMDVYSDKRGTLMLVEMLFERHMENIQEILQLMGDCIDVILFYDDLSYQTNLFIPVELYREIFKPYHQKMWEYIHKNSGLKVCLHCCGAAYGLIPDFIDAGMDILNPVQINAEGMDPATLKKEFGKDISFWGGGCDTVTLTTGTPDQVSEEVKANIDILGNGGGYVFSSIHNITAEVSAANIIAMFKAASRM